MRRADRLFDIIQRLRAARGPITAATLAEALEVTVRTVYRDIAALQGRRVPIEGEAGIGYILRRGYDLPPLMFTQDEIDAIALGARLVRRVRDRSLHEAAGRVLQKVMAIVPDGRKDMLGTPALYVSDGSAAEYHGVDLGAVRDAIRVRRKMRISYTDEAGRRTERTVRPIAIAYYVDVTLIAAWCELRDDYRHFRVERIAASSVLDERFSDDGGKLLATWLSMQTTEATARAGV